MKRLLFTAFLPLIAMGCSSNVTDKVLQDFGLQERPDDYESGADRAFVQLRDIGRTELQRLNSEARQGEVKFEESDDLFGKFYKEVKVYEDFHPIDARQAYRSSGDRNAPTSYVGTIEYSYRVYQSARTNTRAEAAAASATISTGITGRDTLRYNLDRSGNWTPAR